MSDAKPPIPRRPNSEIKNYAFPGTPPVQSILKAETLGVSIPHTPDQELSDAGNKRVSFDAEVHSIVQA